MSTATAPVGLPALPVPGPSHGTKSTEPTPVFVDRLRLDGCDWETYERFLAAIGDRPIRCTYDRGRLEIMAPMRFHEREKKLLGSMVERMAVARKMVIEPCGSMTIRREDLQHGIEPDECFYIANAFRMIENREPDFRVDPPPDLAIEVDITSSSIDRVSLYRSIGVPELWRFDGQAIQFLQLRPGGYEPCDASLSFPFLTAAGVNRFLPLVGAVHYLEILEQFETWLQTVIPSSGA